MHPKTTEKVRQTEALKSGNLIDLYDEDGNPWYDTTNIEYNDLE